MRSTARPNLPRLLGASRALLVLILVPSLTGCAMMRTKKEVATAKTLGLMSGSVMSETGTENVHVLMWRETDEGRAILGVADLSEYQDTWGFLGYVKSRYYFGAFQDLDGDRIRDEAEPAAFHGEQSPIRLENAGEKVYGIQLTLQKDFEPPAGFVFDASKEDLPVQAALKFAVGEIVTLDDPRFAVETAENAMWQPLSGMVHHGAGLYFLEEYDPERIPVLFVHGIGGTPLDSRVLIEKLDRSKFQPWIFSYPSGFRLTTIAKAVEKRLVALTRQLGVDSIYIVAHSMGGLVSRGLIFELADDPQGKDLVKLLITFSSPIDGHPAAALGLRMTPEPVPAWYDMDPASDFVARIKQPLPNGIPWHLFFGFNRAGNVFMRASHDSVVEVESQIPMWAQEEAVDIWGFDNDHMTILTDEMPVKIFLKILDSFATGDS